MTLMQADLEFEYPHKLERMKVQADVYEMAVKEEEKLKFAEFADEARQAQKRILSYEEYFQLDPNQDGHVITKKGKTFTAGSVAKAGMSYEDFLKQRSNKNWFYNDLMELEYKFWESKEDKELRIKQLWIELNKKKALR